MLGCGIAQLFASLIPDLSARQFWKRGQLPSVDFLPPQTPNFPALSKGWKKIGLSGHTRPTRHSSGMGNRSKLPRAAKPDITPPKPKAKAKRGLHNTHSSIAD